jgi:apolipoprotein N-acyltransferase
LTRTARIEAAGTVLGGAALAFAQPGFGAWPLAWVGIAPLLLAMRGSSPKRAFGFGWLAGFVYYGVVLYWIAPTIATYTRITMPAAIVLELLLALAAGWFIGVFAAVVEWMAASGISRVIAAPAVWIVLEWSRTFFPAAFPWGFVGYSQFEVLPILQIADVAGIYGLSALIVFVNAALVELLRDGVRSHVKLTIALAVVVASALGYGGVRLAQVRALDGPSLRVGLVQANIAQEQKWRPGLDESILARHVTLTASAIRSGAELVVWPEAAVPFFFNRDRRTEQLREFARNAGVTLLVGAPGYEQREGDVARQYNQAWMVQSDGSIAGPYDKIRLVPFGEYVPWGGIFGLVQRAVEGIGDFGFGTSYVVFEGPPAAGSSEPTRASALICYEAIFPDLTRKFVQNGAMLLVNVSNDAWYGRTAAPHQLLAMIAVRAVENRVPLVRATNTGVSAVVKPDGTITDTTPLFEEAVIVDDVEIVRGASLYTLLGDWLVYVSAFLIVGLVIVRTRSGSLLIPSERRGILST